MADAKPWLVEDGEMVSATLKYTKEHWHNIIEEAQRQGIHVYTFLHDTPLKVHEAQKAYVGAGGVNKKKGR